MMRVYSLPTHSRLRRATMLGGAWPRLSRASGAAGEVSSNSKASCEVTGTSTWEGGHPELDDPCQHERDMMPRKAGFTRSGASEVQSHETTLGRYGVRTCS